MVQRTDTGRQQHAIHGNAQHHHPTTMSNHMDIEENYTFPTNF